MAAEGGAGEELLVLHERWVRMARAHLREIVAVVVGVVLVLSLWAGYRFYQDRREGKAAILYLKALSLKDRARGYQALQRLMREYPGTVVAREARLYLWERDLSRKPPADLLKEIKQISRGARGEMKISCTLGRAYLLEEIGRPEEAADLYQKAIRQAPFARPVVYADLARVYEAQKKYRLALEFYQKYLETRPSDEGLSFVEYKLSELKKGLPQGS